MAYSVSKALPAVFSILRLYGGLPFDVYSILYHSTITSGMDYGEGISHYKNFQFIDKVHFRAMRAFLGIGRSIYVNLTESMEQMYFLC